MAPKRTAADASSRSSARALSRNAPAACGDQTVRATLRPGYGYSSTTVRQRYVNAGTPRRRTTPTTPRRQWSVRNTVTCTLTSMHVVL